MIVSLSSKILHFSEENYKILYLVRKTYTKKQLPNSGRQTDSAKAISEEYVKI